MVSQKEEVVEQINGFSVFFVVSLVLITIVFFSFVTGLSFVTVSPSVGVNNVTGPITEDVNWSINITVNNTALIGAIDSNITQVNVTLPSSFTFLNGTNATNISTSGNGITFINQSSAIVSLPSWAGTILSWNATLTAGAGARGLLTNGTVGNFWFLFNASTPGNYNITVTTMNLSGFQNSTNISVTVNDTTIPGAISFQGATPANGSYVGAGSISINVSVLDNGAIQTIRVVLVNSTGAVLNLTGANYSVSTSNYSNITTFSNISQEIKLQTNFSLNFTNLIDGIYFFNVSVNDTFGNVNTTAFTSRVTVDTVFPVPLYAVGTEVSGIFVSRNFIVVNVSATDANFNSTNISLMNSTGAVLRNNITFNNVAVNATNASVFYINFTGLADGNYSFNVTTNDSAGNVNLSLPTRTVVIDTVAPAVSLGETTSTDSTINVPITIGESTSTINGSCTVNRAGASVSGTGGSQTLSESSLTCSTTYTYVVTCLDQAGNAGSSTKDITTLGCSGGGGGSSSTATTTTPVFKTVQTVTESQIVQGVVSSLGVNEKVSVPVAGVSHSVGVVSFSVVSGQATIEVASTPIRATLKVGQTQQFNVDNDTYYDLNVTLNSVSASKVNVTIMKVRELLPSVIDGSKPQTSSASDPGSLQDSKGTSLTASDTSSNATNKKSFMNGYVYLIMVIIAIIIIFLIFQRRLRR